MKTKFSQLVFAFLLLSITIANCQEVFYVTASNGLIVRSNPDVSGKRVGKLTFGTQIQIALRTGIKFEIREHQKVVQGEWVKINESKYPVHMEDIGDKFIFDGYLTPKEEYITDVKKLLTTYGLGDRYLIRTDNNPFYLKGDFNGDVFEDHIILVSDAKSIAPTCINGKGKIVILYGGKNKDVYFFGNDDDPFKILNYNWVGVFERVPKGTKIWSNWDDEKDDFIIEDPPENKKHLLATDAFFIHNEESCGGAYIYWKNGEYVWMQVE